MNIGEKISLYKEKLGFRNYQDWGKAVGINGSWILDLSKKDEVSFIDINNLKKLADYLNVTIDQLLKDDEEPTSYDELKTLDSKDLYVIMKKIIFILDNEEEVRIDGKLLNSQAKSTCKDSLQVVEQLVRQYL